MFNCKLFASLELSTSEIRAAVRAASGCTCSVRLSNIGQYLQHPDHSCFNAEQNQIRFYKHLMQRYWQVNLTLYLCRINVLKQTPRRNIVLFMTLKPIPQNITIMIKFTQIKNATSCWSLCLRNAFVK